MTYANGTFRARAVQGSAALGFTASGNEQVGVQFQILEGEDEGKHIVWYGSFTEKSTNITLKALRAAGWQGDDLFDLSTIGDPDASDVMLVIEDETRDNGDIVSRVRWVNSVGAGVAFKEKLDEGQARAFAARMKGAVIAHRQGAGGATQTPRNGQRPAPSPSRAAAPAPRSKPPGYEQAPPHNDDDIPF